MYVPTVVLRDHPTRSERRETDLQLGRLAARLARLVRKGRR